jgi:hypothetical protein
MGLFQNPPGKGNPKKAVPQAEYCLTTQEKRKRSVPQRFEKVHRVIRMMKCLLV